MIQLPTPFSFDLDVRPAGLGDRIVAYLIDALIGVAYSLMLLLLFAWVIPAALRELPGSVELGLFIVLASPFVFYHLVCEVYFDGQSLGKRAQGIRVVSTDGSAPSVGSYVLRWLFRVLDIASYGVVAIVAITATRRSQRVGDLVAGTLVVKRAAKPELDRTAYAPVPPDYAVRYPGAERLADRDVETVKAVLARLRAEGRTPTSAKLARRAREAVQRAARIGQVEEHDEQFLRRVVTDYNALLDSYDVPIESQSSRRTTREPDRSASADAGP